MANTVIRIVEDNDLEDIEAVRALWRDYWEWLGMSDDFQGFGAELLELPGKYARPSGRLWLARVDGAAAATIAFRALGEDACEAKRLFVLPAYRRRGLAAQLLALLIEEARRCGYRTLYGDTLPAMSSALELYRQTGFETAGPYSENPTPGAIYLRMAL